MAIAADALGVLRLAAAVATPVALGRALDGSGPDLLPAALWGIAAGSDFVDGRVARASGRPTRHGAVLDNLADLAFVLAATGAGAAHGIVSWAAPLAIAASFAGYAIASSRGKLARSRLGHAGGVLNYGLAGVIAGAVAWPGQPWTPALPVASLLVVAVNGASLATRLLPRRAEPPARATPVGGSTVR